MDNTKDNNVAVTMTTRFIVVIGAVTEQLAAMGVGWEAKGLLPGFGNPNPNRPRHFEGGWEGWIPSTSNVISQNQVLQNQVLQNQVLIFIFFIFTVT